MRDRGGDGDAGIRHVRSTPYHPQTCGKVERFHRTGEEWLAKRDAAVSLAKLRPTSTGFLFYYNTVRPHRAIGRRTPAEAFAGRPKAAPTLAGFTVPAHFRVRRDKVDVTGVITLRHNSRLHHIGLGRNLSGTRVLALVDGLHVRVLTQDARAIVRWKDVPGHV